jgi:hypothetical protein
MKKKNIRRKPPIGNGGDLQEPIEKGGTDSIYKAYVREYIPRKYGQKYGTNVPPSIGS